MAHYMGLGKTLTTIAFLHTMHYYVNKLKVRVSEGVLQNIIVLILTDLLLYHFFKLLFFSCEPSWFWCQRTCWSTGRQSGQSGWGKASVLARQSVQFWISHSTNVWKSSTIGTRLVAFSSWVTIWLRSCIKIYWRMRRKLLTAKVNTFAHTQSWFLFISFKMDAKALLQCEC